MKSLTNYIFESSKEFVNNVPSDVKSFCYKMMQGLDYSKLNEMDEQDPDRFDKSKSNEQLFIDSLADDSYEFMTTSQYYESINKSKKWDELSNNEQASFDRKNGDIIVLKNEKPIYFIDVKISNNYLGAVSLGSLIDFKPDGYYLCINKKSKQYKVVSHKSLVDAVKDNPDLLNDPIKGKSYVGYDVKWEGETKKSECFVKGMTIKQFK